MKLLVLALVTAVILVGGCFGPSQTSTPPASAPRPRSEAQITILSPQPGEQLAGVSIAVKLALTNGEVTPLSSGPLRPDLGHIHVTVDGQLVSMLSGLEQTVSVSKGMHVLQAEFVAIDHLPFEPRVITATTFRVK
jgi:hypothetical protein